MTIQDEHLRKQVANLVTLARHAGLERALEFQLHILRLQGDQAARYGNESLARKVLQDADALRERIETASTSSMRTVRGDPRAA